VTPLNVSPFLDAAPTQTTPADSAKATLTLERLGLAALLAVICALLLVPLWSVAYPPLVDYPNHLARYFILAHLANANSGLAQFYRANWGPVPYVSLDLVAVALQHLLPIYTVGRIMLSVCLLGVPLAAYFFLRQVNPANKYVGLWALTIAYGPLFLLGFLNEMWGEAFCFLLLGLWLKYLRNPACGLWLALFGIGTLLYFTHLVGFAMAGLVMVTYGLMTRQAPRRMLSSLSVFIPGVLVHVRAMARGTGGHYGQQYQLEYAPKLLRLLDPFRGYTRFCVLLALVGVVISVALALWKNPDLKLNYPWIGVSSVVLVCCLITPQSFHQLDRRLLSFLFIFVLCMADVGRRARPLALIALLVFAGRCVDYSHAFFSQQAGLLRLARAIAVVPPHSRVLTMSAPFGRDGYFRHPDLHFSAYGVIERAWFSPILFHTQGLHPLAFRVSAYPQQQFWPQTAGIDPDWQRVQSDYDYLWVSDLPRFFRPLSAFAQPVYTNDALTVFRVRRAGSLHK